MLVSTQSADLSQFYEARGVKISMLGAYNEVSLFCIVNDWSAD